jgi:hypothetical protein
MLMGVFDWFYPESGENRRSAVVNQHRWSGLSDPCSGNSAVVAGGPRGFDLGRGAHPERGVAAPAVVELDVVVDRGGELDPGLPATAVEQLDLHAAPEALHHRIVRGRANRAHRRSDSRGPDSVTERLRAELRPAIGVDDQPVAVPTALRGGPERVEDQHGGLRRLN